MSTEVGAVKGLMYLGGILVTALFGLISWAWVDNSSKVKGNNNKLDRLNDHLHQNYYTKTEHDKNMKLMIEPLKNALDQNTEAVKGLTAATGSLERTVAVLEERSRNDSTRS